MQSKNKEYLDVVCVGTAGKDNGKIIWVMRGETKENAEACIKMAVMRQGVEDRFFTTSIPGRYLVGDTHR
jgi:hypothetical protein